MSDDDKTRRAARAATIMDDEMVRGALAEIEASLIAGWHGSPFDDQEGRENCYRQLRALRAFRQVFHDAMAEGEVVAHRVKQKQQDTI